MLRVSVSTIFSSITFAVVILPYASGFIVIKSIISHGYWRDEQKTELDC
jgi:hypothetical protein